MATNNPNQAVQDYINRITQQYNAVEALITAMQHDGSQITKDDRQIGYDQSHLTYTTYRYIPGGPGGVGTTVPEHHTDATLAQQISNLHRQTQALHSDILAKKAAVEAFDPAFKALDNTLNSLLDCLNKVLADGGVKGQNIGEDVDAIHALLTKLFEAMKSKLQADKYAALIEDDVNGDLSQGEIAEFVQGMISNQTDETNDIGAIRDLITNDVKQFHKDSDDAKADHASYNKLEEWTNWGGADDKEAKDDRIMQNSADMIKGLTSVLNSIAPEAASLTPEFTQIKIVLEEVMRKIEKILKDVHLTAKEKSTQILGLLMFVLGIFSQIKTEAETVKADNEKNMATANQAASEMNIDDVEMNQKIMQEELHNASVMKTFMLVAKIVMGVIFTLMAPGVGSMALMAGMTVLDATGVLDTATQDLGTAMHCQVAADVIVAVAEVILTAGGGALLDLMIEKAAQGAVKAAVEAAVEAAEDSIESMAQKSVEAAGKTVAQGATAEEAEAALNTARNEITATVKSAAEKAAKTTAKEFLSQNPFTTIFGKMTLKEATATAAKKAAVTAAEDSDTVMIGKLAVENLKASAADVDRVVNKAAAEGVSSVTGQSVNDGKITAGTLTKVTRSAATTAAIRGGAALAYGLASTNFLVDLAKKIKDSDSQSYQDFLIFLQVFQGLVQMLAFMAGSGALSQATFEGSPSQLARIATLLSLLPQGANAAGNIGMYETENSQADATKGLTLANTIADMLQSNMQQMQQDANLERDRYIKDESDELGSQLNMSEHLFDGDAAAIRVLAQQAV